MNIDEVGGLLKVLAAYDGRNIGEADLMVWMRQLADVDAVDAVEAVHEYYAATRDWAYPADIRAIAARLRNRRNKRPEVVAPGCYEPDEDLRRRLRPSDDGTRALPTGDGTRDRSADVRELVTTVAAGWTDQPDSPFRRPEVVEWDRQRDRARRHADTGPNPDYDPDMARPVAEWQRTPGKLRGPWWMDEAKREEHATRLLDEAGRLRPRLEEAS